jgi:hypothetical protein
MTDIVISSEHQFIANVGALHAMLGSLHKGGFIKSYRICDLDGDSDGMTRFLVRNMPSSNKKPDIYLMGLKLNANGDLVLHVIMDRGLSTDIIVKQELDFSAVEKLINNTFRKMRKQLKKRQV